MTSKKNFSHFSLKNGSFRFKRADLPTVMRQFARWYNVEVEYVGEVPTNKFGGAVSRYDNVSKVLRPLEETGMVKFKIEGRRITVMP